MPMLPAAGRAVQILVLVAILLVVARGLGAVTDRLGLTRVVGELATGFVLGPSAFGRLFPAVYEQLAPAVTSPLLNDLSLLGLVLLLTLAGLETDVELVRSYARDVVAIGSAGLAFPFVLGVGLGLVIKTQGEYPRLQARDESDNPSTIHHRWQRWIFHRSQPKPLQ
jgi:Kef-type K+ transport system membrane component KefB